MIRSIKFILSHLVLTVVVFSACSQKSSTVLVDDYIAEDATTPALFATVLADAVAAMEPVINQEIVVPIPVDMGGGYTHERHKLNYRELQTAGQLYTETGDEKYADYCKKMFLAYAQIYPGLPKHPTDRSYATGKIFWQSLNDANWMVYGSQAYAAIYDYLSTADRQRIEDNFLRPYADYISIDSPQFFNRVHNHSTWGNAAVGMVGLAIKDQELVDRALYGLQLDEVDRLAKDNDGGFIYEGGKAKAGFFAQIDFSFSPDGYYGEGPYYQRYAMLPFMIFAQALEDEKPEIGIFAYRDSILVKAVEALLNQTTTSDEFFPINDAQKGMSIHPNSVVTAVDIAYAASKKPIFLSAAKKQATVLLTPEGRITARDLASLGSNTFVKKSINLRDGADGTEGGLAIMRAGAADRQTTLVFKYTAQGMGHGHYDKLTYLLYDGDTEVMQDYGAARWVNIDQKAGGRYLPENNSWAKQTIAHNTIVMDGQSHFGGVYERANTHHSDLIYFNTENKNIQSVAGIETHAYEGAEIRRYLFLWSDPYFTKPVVIDFMDISTEGSHRYDLPYQFAGQIMSDNVALTIDSPPLIMGDGHGYQHLYQEASAKIGDAGLQMNWMKDMKFYTVTTDADPDDTCIMARIGANDPDFNLRRDPLMIHRKEATGNTHFLSVIENHGNYSPVSEVPISPYPSIDSAQVIDNNQDMVIFEISAKSNRKWRLTVEKKTGNTTIINLK